ERLGHGGAGPVRRHRDVPRLVRPLQYPRRGRLPGPGPRQSAGVFRMTGDDMTDAKPIVAPADAAGEAAQGSPAHDAAQPAASAASALPPEELARMTDDTVAALKTVYDPEIPADIYK